jgi:DNA-binding transcriptional ArsR family regulator
LNEPAASRSIGDLDALRVMADSQRHRLLSQLIAEPMTAASMSERLRIPRTRVYYHLELLERHGFIAVCGYRDAGKAERLYRATAATFRVDRVLLGSAGAALNDARAALLDAAAEDVRRVPPDDDELLVQRTFVRLSPQRRAAFRAALVALVERYARPDPAGNEVEVVAALFAVPGA